MHERDFWELSGQKCYQLRCAAKRFDRINIMRVPDRTWRPNIYWARMFFSNIVPKKAFYVRNQIHTWLRWHFRATLVAPVIKYSHDTDWHLSVAGPRIRERLHESSLLTEGASDPILSRELRLLTEPLTRLQGMAETTASQVGKRQGSRSVARCRSDCST